jgi:ATP-dependent DNA helicase
MASSSSVGDRSPDLESRLPTSAPSSPPEQPIDDMKFATTEEKAMYEEEKKAQAENDRAEERRRKLALKKKRQIQESKAEREAKAKQLDDLLMNCAKFSDILTKKTEVLGRVGSGFDGKALGEHDLVMAKQPKCMKGGTMRDYQLEGLTWMYEICSQGMSGILADEMGLGKTIQTISLIAKLREEEGYMGPHLIVAPLSTLSNWMDEFKKWVPSIPVAFYHGTPPHRREVFQKDLMKNLVGRRANKKFPVVLTTPEIVIRDANDLVKIPWELIIIVSSSLIILAFAMLTMIPG